MHCTQYLGSRVLKVICTFLLVTVHIMILLLLPSVHLYSMLTQLSEEVMRLHTDLPIWNVRFLFQFKVRKRNDNGISILNIMHQCNCQGWSCSKSLYMAGNFTGRQVERYLANLMFFIDVCKHHNLLSVTTKGFDYSYNISIVDAYYSWSGFLKFGL